MFATGVFVGPLVGVLVGVGELVGGNGVLVGVFVGGTGVLVAVGVFVGVLVGVFEGVLVGVLTGCSIMIESHEAVSQPSGTWLSLELYAFPAKLITDIE